MKSTTKATGVRTVSLMASLTAEAQPPRGAMTAKEIHTIMVEGGDDVTLSTVTNRLARRRVAGLLECGKFLRNGHRKLFFWDKEV